MSYYLSFLMGADKIQDKELRDLGVEIVEKDSDGDRKLKIPAESLSRYIELIKAELTAGFWNEIIGAKEIIFVFKLKDGMVKEYKLSPENEREISKLCAELNNEPEDKTTNIYKYIFNNSFYHEFMLEHWANMISR